jgi:DNA-binding NarL/FixJ family response regulator
MIRAGSTRRCAPVCCRPDQASASTSCAIADGDAELAPPAIDQVARRLPVAVSRTPAALAQVLRMLAGGLTNAEISQALVHCEATVKTHVS